MGGVVMWGDRGEGGSGERDSSGGGAGGRRERGVPSFWRLKIHVGFRSGALQKAR